MKCMALALAAVLAISASAKASIVTFTGSLTYNPIIGAADPLGIAGQTLGIRMDVDGAGNVLSGHIRVVTGPGSHYSIPFNPGTGTGALGANTVWSGINVPAAGNNMTISIAQSIPNFSAASLNLLNGVAGSASLNFVDLGNGNIGSYSGAITAVPEPGSMVALAGLVAGCGYYGWRRRKQAA